MSDKEIIRCVKRHFGNNVAREIRPTTVKNVEDFVQLLDEIEIERERNKKLFDAKKRESKDKVPTEKKREGATKPWNKNKAAEDKKQNHDEKPESCINNKYTKNKDFEKSKEDDGKSYCAKNDQTDQTARKNEKPKNNNASAKTGKTAFNKGFSTQRNLAVVKAENRTDQSEEENEGEEKSPKLAVIRANRQKPNKRENKNKTERDRVNALRFAKLSLNVEEDMKSESATENKGKNHRNGKSTAVGRKKVSVITKTALNVESVDNDENSSDNGATDVDWLVEDVDKSTEIKVQSDVETENTIATESPRKKIRVKDDKVERGKQTRKTENHRDATLKKKGERAKLDTVERGEATRSTKKYGDATLNRERESVKDDTSERDDAMRSTNKHCDVASEEQRKRVKGDGIKRDKVLRRKQTTRNAKTKEKIQDQSENEFETEQIIKHKSVIPSVRINKIIDQVDELSREDQQKKRSIGSAYVDIEVDDLSVNALLDTGAEISAMTKALFDSLVEIKAITRVIPLRKHS